MKIINSLLTRIIGNEQVFDFEDRFIIACIFFSLLVCFVSVFANILLYLGSNAVVVVSISSVVLASLYVAARVCRKLKFARLLYTIYAFLFCNFYWLANYGSRGSAVCIFLVYYTMMIFFWNNKQIRIVTFFVLSDIFALLFLELSNPGLIPFYPSENSRIIDSYGSMIMFLVMLSLFAVSAKTNYLTQYKNAQRSDQLKTAFLANMSHEIRTPLNAIIGFAKLVSTKELTKDKKEHYTKLIDDNSKYLLKLVSDILDISLIESGMLKIAFIKTDINELFLKLYRNFEHLLGNTDNKKLKLLLDVPNENCYVETDNFRLEQIMSNLLDNAMKFTNEGYIRFGYFIEDNQIIFYVEDTGIGIKEELQPEIFSRFVKHDDESVVKFSRGTGIGLSLTKDLAKLLGGKIWFTSQYHEGSTFYFSLPNKVLSFVHKID
jgi:signal transduction histidine kinase